MPSRWVLVGLFHPWDFIGSWLVPTDLGHYSSSAKPWRTTSSPPLGMLWFGGRSTSKSFLNTTDMPSTEEAASGDSKVDSPILMAELAKGVKKLLSGTRSDIHLEFLKVLDGRLWGQQQQKPGSTTLSKIQCAGYTRRAPKEGHTRKAPQERPHKEGLWRRLHQKGFCCWKKYN